MQLCDLAAKYNLKVNLEFVTYSGITSLKDAMDLLKLVEKPNAYLLIDTIHAHRSQVMPEEMSKMDPMPFKE